MRTTEAKKSLAPVKITCIACMLGTWALSMHSHLHAKDLGPEMRIDEPSHGGAAQSPLPTVTMCAKADEVVFSCPLDKSKKLVSMCATAEVASGTRRFYYAYGPAGSPELVFPVGSQPSNGAFTRTHLGFAGHTGGYAYGFTNKGYKYTIYSLSGERSTQQGGVIVQSASDSKVVAKMQCWSGKITETESDPVLDATLKWSHDSGIETNDLPAL